MKRASTALGCFRYAQFVFVAEIFLAIYWIGVLTYVSVEDHTKLLSGLIFGLHYAGLIALSGLLDDVTEKKNAVVYYGRSLSFSSSEGKIVVRNAKNATPTNDPTALDEKKLVKKLSHYPLAYGVALFVSMISDLFSLVDAVLEHLNDEIGIRTYYLYVILFALGLCLTVSSIVWSVVFYVHMRSVARRSIEGNVCNVNKIDS